LFDIFPYLLGKKAKKTLPLSSTFLPRITLIFANGAFLQSPEKAVLLAFIRVISGKKKCVGKGQNSSLGNSRKINIINLI